MSTLLKTPAVVLHRTPYNDRHSIVHLYTREYGRLGLLVPATTKRSKQHLLLTPLSEVEITAELMPRRSLASLREVRMLAHHHRMQQESVRRSQGIFIAELLYRVLTHSEADADLYDFVSESLTVLEYVERGVANFYLCFTYQLLRPLAIAPTLERGGYAGRVQWFDLAEARLVDLPTSIRRALAPEEVKHLLVFDRMHYGNLGAFRYSREQRGYIIDRLLEYYRLHLPPFPEIRCLEVLRSTAH